MRTHGRWWLTAVLSMAALVWALCCLDRPERFSDAVAHWREWLTPAAAAVDPRDAAALEGRWLGRAITVRHHRHAAAPHFFARLDGADSWSIAPPEDSVQEDAR